MSHQRSAHPMIQPSDWSRTPDELAADWPSRNLAVYRLIWDSALANVARPPLLRYRRSVARLVDAESLLVAIDQIDSAPDQLGWWQFRKDVPDDLDRAPAGFAPGLQNDPGVTLPQKLTVENVELQQVGAFTIDGLLVALEEQGITTPASVAESLYALLYGDERVRPVLTLTKGTEQSLTIAPGGYSGDDIRVARIQVTPHGDSLLARWSTANLPMSPAVWDSTAESAWEHLSVPVDRAARFEGWIDQAIASTPIRVIPGAHEYQTLDPLDLPDALNPELQLPQSHPLRLVKEEMESALRASIPDWADLTDVQRQRLRRMWLEPRLPLPDVPSLDGPAAELSPLSWWLLGRTLSSYSRRTGRDQPGVDPGA